MTNRVLLYGVGRGYRIDENGDCFLGDKKRSLNFNKLGYASFTIRFNKKECRRIYAHRLQAYQIYGEALFGPDIVVRHLDGNSRNNSKINIGIGTQKENIGDIPQDIRIRKAMIATSYVRRFTQEQAEQIKKDREGGATYTVLMEKYNLSKSTLSYMFNKAKYMHLR